MDELVCMEHSYIVVEDGRVAGVFRTLPERYAQLPVLDYGEQLILPGMTDLHVHAPQFAFRGLGMDMELLEWLNTYTFPEESKYKELEYADRAYGSFVNHLLHSTTTRATRRSICARSRRIRRCGTRSAGSARRRSAIRT